MMTCNPKADAKATLPNLLDMSLLRTFADSRIEGSVSAVASSGKPWIMGETNSIACEGKAGVTDTFGQALYLSAQALQYASIGAAKIYLHQGATLLTRGGNAQQANQGTKDGTPSFSAYSLLYPVNSTSRGQQRANPGFASQLLLAEAIGTGNKSRILALDPPSGADARYFYAAAVYDESVPGGTGPARLILINTEPYTEQNEAPAGSSGFDASKFSRDNAVTFDFSSLLSAGSKAISSGSGNTNNKIQAKRLTAPYVDTKETHLVTWAGQSYKYAAPEGPVAIEDLSSASGKITLRNSEAVLVFLRGDPFVAEGSDETNSGASTGASHGTQAGNPETKSSAAAPLAYSLATSWLAVITATTAAVVVAVF